MRWLIVLLLAAIIVSLGSGLFYLTRGDGDSGKLARALTWRIGLSLVLILGLVGAAMMGWITPGQL